MKLSDFQALTFDCYGTLIDWEKGLLAALQGLVSCAPKRRSTAPACRINNRPG